MSEKKWTLKWTSSGRRGRNHKGKEFPRHATNLYEGTHLGMRKRIWSKSSSGYVYGQRGCVLRKEYIISLLNRFVGKPFKDFKLVFDPTLVRGMSYYTGTIFEIAMPELGAACGGGGRYDKMVGKFTGQDVPACGFSIGFERIVLLLLESGFTVPMQRPKVAYLIEKGFSAEKLSEVIAKAQQERQAGKQVLVVRMNKNKKFQKEKLVAEGYKDIVEFFNN